METQSRVAYVSTYPPRECGIATFTRDLAQAVLMRGHANGNIVVAIEDDANRNNNTSRTIDQHNRRSYFSAADFLNESAIDVVSLQHEFGIFGGEWGEYVLDLCRNVEKPIVTTFHTVLRNPPEKARQIVREICKMSSAVVVTIESAARLLEKRFGVSADKIMVIRHGAALPDRRRKAYAKQFLAVRGRTVLATFGLISPGKGIEFAIKSLTYMVKERPDLLYLVIGETHPEVRKHEGEAYREKLVSLARRLGLEQNVQFVNRYLREEELSLYLQAVDVYIAPYLGRDQVSSGTLTLALGYGKAVVATSTTFAKEILSNERGLCCRFADARSIAECVERILSDSRLRHRLEENARQYGQDVGWAKVGDEYGNLFRSAIRVRGTLSEVVAVSEA
jgi:glycosyltransferase involved in cell wall biosynthesis